MDDKRGYSPVEFCERYPIGRSKLYELMRAGAIGAVKIGTRTIIPDGEAERWFESLPTFAEKRRPRPGRRVSA
jgi:hypothetical protein